MKAASGLKDFPVIQAPQPDWKENAVLASEVGRKSIALFRDRDNILPITDDIESILVIGPDDSWEFYTKLKETLESQNKQVDVVNYSPPWDGKIEEREYIQTLPKQAENYDLTIFLTWRAHHDAIAKDKWQANLGKRLSKLDKPVIITALHSPTDIYEFPNIGTYLATHGTTDEQMRALIDILIGDLTPNGVIPLPQFYE